MQTCSTMRPFSMTTIWSAVLNGGEPMSNHDGSALVRNTVERLPPQSFALGVARGSRLIKQQHRCVQHRREHPLCPAGGLARRAGRDQSAAGEDNQILRHGGRTADGSSVAWAVAAKQVQVALKFVSSESRPRFVACMVRTAPRCKRHRGRKIVLDAEQASVWRNRRAGRISEVDDGLLRTALYDAVHIILTTQGLFTTEELGDADRQARRHEQGQGGARPPTGGDHASHACRRSPLQRCSSLTGGAQQFGHDTTPSRSEVPSPGRWIRLGRTTRTAASMAAPADRMDTSSPVKAGKGIHAGNP